MEEDENGSLLPTSKERAIDILLGMEPRLNSRAELAVEYIDNIDSTNMRPEHWDRMADVIEKEYDNYDGFVITHGTDTMAYTASALSYSLQNLGKPVILTGAQMPGSKMETDARRNFVNAVQVATMDLSAIAIVFDEEIILGARSSKVSESKLNAFETINWALLGEIRIDIRLSEDAKPRHSGKLNVQKGFESNIAVVTLIPGTPNDILSALLERGVKGIVMRGFGPGNIASQYLDFIREALAKKIPVVVHTQCMEGATSMHLYDVGKQALDLGVIQSYDMSIEGVTTKLMWAIRHADSYEQIKEIMHTNYTGEINKEGKIY